MNKYFYACLTYKTNLLKLKRSLILCVNIIIIIHPSQLLNVKQKSILISLYFNYSMDVTGLNNFTETSLDVNHCKGLTYKAMIALAKECKSLLCLDIGHCDNFTDAAMIVLAKECKSLTCLNIYQCNNLTDAGMIVLAKERKSLTCLNIYQCNNLTITSIKALRERCK